MTSAVARCESDPKLDFDLHDGALLSLDLELLDGYWPAERGDPWGIS